MPLTEISESAPVVVEPSTRREPKESVTMLALMPALLSDASALIESRTDCSVAPGLISRLNVSLPCLMVSGPSVIELVVPAKAALATLEEVARFVTSMAYVPATAVLVAMAVTNFTSEEDATNPPNCGEVLLPKSVMDLAKAAIKDFKVPIPDIDEVLVLVLRSICPCLAALSASTSALTIAAVSYTHLTLPTILLV